MDPEARWLPDSRKAAAGERDTFLRLSLKICHEACELSESKLFLLVNKETPMMKNTSFLVLSCALSLSTVLCGIASAEDGSDASRKEPKTFKATVEEQPSANTIDFAAALELPFQSLTTLGARIEQARRNADPVGLMNTARELAVAEELSGKKAPLTAAELEKEAVELAKLRSNPPELKAVALMVDNQETKKALKQAIEQAEKREAEEAAALEAGERPKHLVGDLIVDNHTHHWADIRVNGSFRGSVAPHGHEHFRVRSYRDQTILDAHVRGLGSAHEHVHTHEPYFRWGLYER